MKKKTRRKKNTFNLTHYLYTRDDVTVTEYSSSVFITVSGTKLQQQVGEYQLQVGYSYVTMDWVYVANEYCKLDIEMLPGSAIEQI